MRNILLKIEYDGTEFSGWQRQPQEGVRTVQATVEEALSRICGQDIRIDGTGRTDAGVHALGQCATFSGDFGIPADRIAIAANDIFAQDRLKGGPVRILSAEEVDPDFHARFSACGKTYIYRIFNAPHMPVFLRNYRYNVKKPLDIQAMKAAAAAFEGKHDFAAFMAAGGTPQLTTVRTIYGVRLSVTGDDADRREDTGAVGGAGALHIDLAVTGDGFLYNMVRIIAGTLVDVGLGRLAPEEIPEIIAGCDRQKAGHTAPPQGLYMAEVYFDKDIMKERAAGPFVLKDRS